jgi:hypothetical protein
LKAGPNGQSIKNSLIYRISVWNPKPTMVLEENREVSERQSLEELLRLMRSMMKQF